MEDHQSFFSSIQKKEESVNILKEFLSFGHPREGSIKYHKAWEKLNSSSDNLDKAINLLNETYNTLYNDPSKLDYRKVLQTLGGSISYLTKETNKNETV
jgi:hypothetical protein